MKSKLSVAASIERPLRITPSPDSDQRQFRTTYERHLARLLRHDEPAAAAGLWDHFSPLVRGLLLRLLGPSAEIESDLQQIFLRVHRRGRRLLDPDRLRQFVVGVVIDRVRGQLRRRWWRRAIGRLLGPSPRANHHRLADGGPVTVHRLALAELYQALDDLRPNQRISFALHFFEGLDPGETTALARKSGPALKRCLDAARRKLQAAGLTEAGDDDHTLHRLARLARAASSRPQSPATARATRARFLQRIARNRNGGGA